jgi:hypothetical protein
MLDRLLRLFTPRLPVPRQSGPRRLVIMLGMHNSGTSLLARIVTPMGVGLGPNVLTRESFAVAPRYDYWEHAGITETQEELLRVLDRHWGEPRADWPIPAEAWRRPEVLALKARLIGHLQAELAATPGLWGFKDPRTVRLMPLWLDLAAGLRLAPLYLISLRAPAVVATSFASKGQVPWALAERLWTRHYFEALLYTRGAPRLVVDYDDWFTDGPGTFGRLADFLGLAEPAARAAAWAEVASVIDPGLKQYTAGREESLRPITRDLHALLRRMAAGDPAAAETAALLARAAELSVAA